MQQQEPAALPVADRRPEEEAPPPPRSMMAGRQGRGQQQRPRGPWGLVMVPAVLLGLLCGPLQEAAGFVLRPGAPPPHTPARRTGRPRHHGGIWIPAASSPLSSSSPESGPAGAGGGGGSSSRPPRRRANGTTAAAAARASSKDNNAEWQRRPRRWSGPPRPSPRQLEINRELLACEAEPEALLRYASSVADEMNLFNFATLFNRLSKASTRPADVRADPRFRALVAQAEAALPACGAADLSLVLNGVSRLGHNPGEEFWARARDASLRVLPHATQAAAFVNTLNAFGRTRFNPGPRWLAVFLEASAPRLPAFSASELSSLVNSFANLRFLPPPAYYAAVSAGIRQRLPEMRPWELGMITNGLGRLAAVASSGSSSSSSSNNNHSNQNDGGGGGGGSQGRVYTVVDDETGGAFHPGFELVRALEEAAAPRLGEFEPQGLAFLVNGFLNLGHQPKKAFLVAFIRCCMERMPRFNSQDYGIILNGLAALGVQPEELVPGFLGRLRELALPKLLRFNDQELANLINALGKWGADPGPDFIEAFCKCARRRLESFTPQGLANVLHALGRLGHYPGPALVDGIVARCLALADGFTAQGLAMVLCGLSNLRHHPGDAALGALAAAATRRAAGLDQQYLSMVWWGTANLGFAPPPAFWAACRERVAWHRILDRLSLFEASTLLYALAVMDAPAARPFLGPLVKRACRNLEARAWVAEVVAGDDGGGGGDDGGKGAKLLALDLETESALRQLHQAFMYIETLRAAAREGAAAREEEGDDEEEEGREIAPGLTYALQREFGGLIAGAWGASADHLLAARVTTSSLQMQVQQAAEALGLCCLPEVRDGPFTLDIVIPPNPASPAYTGQLPVVIEVDGPTHYCRNSPQRMTGVSRLKHRLLLAQRDRWAAVVSVSLPEWEPLGFSGKRKRAFLEARLRGAGVELDAYRFEGQQECALLDPADHCSPEVLLQGQGQGQGPRKGPKKGKGMGPAARRKQRGGGAAAGGGGD